MGSTMPKSPVSNAWGARGAVPQGHANPSASFRDRRGIPSASHLLGEEALVLDLVTAWLGVRLSSGMVGRFG